MRTSSAGRAVGPHGARRPVGWAVVAALVLGAAGCGSGGAAPSDGPSAGKAAGGAGQHQGASRDSRSAAIPGVADRFHKRVPDGSTQVVTVQGKGRNSAAATVRLYSRGAGGWVEERSWPAHNGKKGWTPNHRAGDDRSPVGVFGLSDAGGALPAPDSKLPYTHSGDFAPPAHWPEGYQHDFDHVIAVDYNRVAGASPLDARRPEGQSRGGGIWLHLDHGSGTSGCVSLSSSGLRYLLRTLDPERKPTVVMGDRATLAG